MRKTELQGKYKPEIKSGVMKKNKHQQTPKSVHRRSKGFALIVVMSMVALITLLTVGLVSLAARSTATANSQRFGVEAQANALLSLNMALGDLQKQAGPDRRVTARMDVRDGSSDQERHWIGVWKTDQVGRGGEVPIINWAARDQSLEDLRSGRFSSDNLFLGRLVSGAEGGLVSGELINVVGPGSVADESAEVDVPLVEITGTNSRSAHGWWISDESLKATAVPFGRLPAASDDLRLALPDRVGVGVLAGLEGFDQVPTDRLERIVGRRQLDFAGAGDPSDWDRQFHSLTTVSRSVLADPLRGGLKTDLSRYLLEGDVPSRGDLEGIDDNTGILTGNFRLEQGPRYGTLRAFQQLAERSTGEGVPPTASPNMARTANLTGISSFANYQAVPDLTASSGHPIHPVIASAQLYTRFSYIRGFLAVHLYPRITLWNPHNVAIEAEEYTIYYDIGVNDSITLERRNPNEDVLSTGFDSRANKENRLRLQIEPTRFEPGEALVFTPLPRGNAIANRAMPLVRRNESGFNTMSASVNPRAMTNFYITLNQLPSSITVNDLPLYANHNRGAYYWIDLMNWNRDVDTGVKVSLHLGQARNFAAMQRLPLLQYIDLNNYRRFYEGSVNNGRWKVGGVEEVLNYETTADIEPWARTNYGFRYKWWREVNPSNLAGAGANRLWQAGVTSDYNLRGTFHHRSPFDNITDNGEAHHWYQFGPFAAEREQGLPYLSPELAAHPGPNGFRGNIFFEGSLTTPDHVYPLYDVPRSGERIVSMGRFQHARLSQFGWHAGRAVGSGFVQANVTDRRRSGDLTRNVSDQWSNNIPWLPEWLVQRRRRDEVVYDLAYEVNHELWDRHFLSGATSNEKLAFFQDPANNIIPNHRLVPLDISRGSDFADFHRAATAVMLHGGFNVNSTDVAAWRAVLSSLRELPLGDSSEGTPFPRFFNDVTDDPIATTSLQLALTAPEVWSATTRLTDEQIDNLAEAIVVEVRRRGPFVSVSDFVNRRLTSTDEGLKGTLDAAIERARINDPLIRSNRNLAQMNLGGWGVAAYEPGDPNSSPFPWGERDHLRSHKVYGLPTFLQQTDILQTLGGMLVARGDTFVIRAYGDTRSSGGTGRVLARAWCEVEVQRVPDFVDGTNPPETPVAQVDGALNEEISEINRRFGRQFRVVSFRWLAPDEV